MPASRIRNYGNGLEVNTEIAGWMSPHASSAYDQLPISPTATLYSPATEYSPTTAYSFSPPSSPISPTHKRRKSSANSVQLDARPKKGDEDYVKRPENAFILFRRKCCEDRQAALEASTSTVPVKKQRQADLSKTISQQWKSLPASERATWEALAKERKKEHEKLHPGYVYRPQRIKGKAAAARRASLVNSDDTSSEEVVFVQPFARHGRSASTPDASLMPMLDFESFDFVPQPFPSFGQQSSPSYWPSDNLDPFTLDPSTLLPPHDISPSHSLHSQPTTDFFPEANVAGMFDAPFGSYGAWDAAAMAMWPQEQGESFDFDLASIAPVHFGGYAYAPEDNVQNDVFSFLDSEQ